MTDVMRIIGATRPWVARAAFASVNAVAELNHDDGPQRVVLPVRPGVDVLPVSDLEWQQHLEQDEWLEFPDAVDVDAGTRSRIWLVRRRFGDARRDELRGALEQAKALIGTRAGPDGVEGWIVRITDQLGRLQADRAEDYFNEAWKAAKHSDWITAYETATVAYQFAPRWNRSAFALRCVAKERLEEKAHSEGLLAAAQNSLSPSEYQRLLGKMDELRRLQDRGTMPLRNRRRARREFTIPSRAA